MSIVQKLIENGVLRRVERFRREVWCFGISEPPDRPEIAGAEIHQQSKDHLHYTTPASLLEVKLSFDMGDEELSLPNEYQVKLLKARIINSLCCLVRNLEEGKDESTDPNL